MALIPSWSSSAHTASFSPFTKSPGGTRHHNALMIGNYIDCSSYDFSLGFAGAFYHWGE